MHHINASLGPDTVLGEILTSASATLAGRDAGLTSTEYEVLRLLSQCPGRLLTNAQLLDSVWGETGAEGTARLRTIIKKLRRKLGDDAGNPTWIFSERGVGYRLAGPKESQPGLAPPVPAPCQRRGAAVHPNPAARMSLTRVYRTTTITATSTLPTSLQTCTLDRPLQSNRLYTRLSADSANTWRRRPSAMACFISSSVANRTAMASPAPGSGAATRSTPVARK